MSAPRRIVLDCDPGHDDAMAILLAAASPAIDLVAITIVAGNQTLEKTALNARRVCSKAGIGSVPIATGRDRPLVRPLRVADEIHGVSGLDGPSFGEPTVALDARDGVDLIVEAALEGGLTLVATGPLTNAAAALAADRRVAQRLERIVFMGGAIGLGNWTPAAEFNIWADPEAARAVLESGVPVTMVPLEVTHQALATPEVMARIDAIDSPVARMAGDLMRFFAETYHRVFGFASPAVHDPCAVAWVIDPTLIEARELAVAIETASEHSDGRTLCDVHGVTGAAPNALVGIGLDADRFWDLMLEALRSY